MAMAVAPELFKGEEAKLALGQIEEVLVSVEGLGVKTLDPEDNEYLSFYDNSDDSDNP